MKSPSSVSLEPIDQLAEKVQSLIGVLEQTRAELERTVQDNTQLSGSVDTLSSEVDALRAQLATVEGENTQVQSLRDERDQVRTRVTEILEQLEELSL